MEQFEFVKDLDDLDYRSVFANKVLKLIYEKHNGNLDAAIKEADPFFEDFEEIIRNIYELVENEIPLYAYARLLKYGADNFHLTAEEFDQALERTKTACKLYYEGK